MYKFRFTFREIGLLMIQRFSKWLNLKYSGETMYLVVKYTIKDRYFS